MTKKPAPCPFCGGENCELTRYDGWHRVECNDCGARSPCYGDEEMPAWARDRQALRAWKDCSA